jgi:hypothetical protein
MWDTPVQAQLRRRRAEWRRIAVSLWGIVVTLVRRGPRDFIGGEFAAAWVLWGFVMERGYNQFSGISEDPK